MKDKAGIHRRGLMALLEKNGEKLTEKLKMLEGRSLFILRIARVKLYSKQCLFSDRVHIS